MVQNVIALELSVGERLSIKKNRIKADTQQKSQKRISITTGIHGDELEGQFVCYELTRRLLEHPEYLKGTVDVYPSLNPLGMDCVSRNIPGVDMDLNRMFPGSAGGSMIERIAAAVIEDIIGSDLCVDVHASDTFVMEIPQVRLSEPYADKLLAYAKLLNTDMIWMNATATVHEATLAHSLNMLGVPTLVVEMGLGNRINRSYGMQMVEGILRLMSSLGMWTGPFEERPAPVVSTDGEVEFIRADLHGVWLPCAANSCYLKPGDKIGEIVDVLSGTCKKEVTTQKGGLLFTVREYPMIYEGVLLARLLTGIGGGEHA